MSSCYCYIGYRTVFIAVVCFCLPGWCAAQIRTEVEHYDHIPPVEYKPGVKAFIIPASFIGYVLVSLNRNNAVRQLDFTTRNELQEDHPSFSAHIDDYMQFAPAAAVYGLNLAGVKGQHSSWDATGVYLLSSAIMGGAVTTLKNVVHRQRPNGIGFNSFPSGHTTTAFAAAEFLKQEYKDVSPWYGVAGYAVATATGTLRMYNNKHWFSDVVAGAGLGILSTKAAYFIYPKLKRLISGNGAVNYNVVPSYQQHSFGLSLNGTF